jgi:polyisoprenoid-binding protein YceI
MTQPRPVASPATAPAPGRYRIDPARTTIQADVRAMFGLLMVQGTFRLRAGEVDITPDPGQSTARANIDAGSFTSGLAARDADVISASCSTRRTIPRSPSRTASRGPSVPAGCCRAR